MLFFDEKDREGIKGARVVLVDDVISTGSTSQGMRRLIEEGGAIVAGEAAICTERDPDQWPGIVALGHLPLFTD